MINEFKWIPCSKRLPDKTMPCLLTTKYKWNQGIHVVIDWWETEQELTLIDSRQGRWRNHNHEAIAWMPLPDAYGPNDEEATDEEEV